MLGLLSAAISGISSAMGAFGQMGSFGEGLANGLADMLKDDRPATKKFNTFKIDKGSLADKLGLGKFFNYSHGGISGHYGNGSHGKF